MAARRKTTSTSDPVTLYARRVTEGELIAGPHVRAACARHLRDLVDGPARGLVWDAAAADRVRRFYSDILRLNGGEFEGVPFVLEPWQMFVVGSLFGWRNADDGTRRFRMAYVEAGKGSGKSPLAAGVGLYGLLADGEPRAEVYAAATKKDQAQILFRDAVAMVEQSPRLSAAVLRSGKNPVWNLAHIKSGSFFRPISADDGQSGPRPHIALIDEIHEHRDNYVVEMLRAGTKGRRQALIFMITNSGADRTSVCFEYHDYAAKVSDGTLSDDSFFGYVCALDEEDNPFDDEACWPKANPSLGVTIPAKYLREQVSHAKGMPSKESVVRRLNFCQWVGAINPWIGSAPWLAAQASYTAEELRGRRCWAGLDLGSTQDLNALVLLFEPDKPGERWRLLPYFWLPADGLEEKGRMDRVPYTTWVRQGFLETTEGRAVNKRAVVQRLAEIASMFDLQVVRYDRWRIEDLKVLLDEEGIDIPLEPHGQGFKDMAPAVDEFERLLLNGEMEHPSNPVLTWNAANAVLATDPAGNRKPMKDKATGRIDGIVAALMATSAAHAANDADKQPQVILL